MKQTLSREHRKTLETTVGEARIIAEAGAEKALKALAVGAKEAPAHASDDQKKLRVRLRAHGRALGDVLRPDDTQDIDHLVTEIAYEHWHRMLFARFLAESDLLMHPDGYPVSLADCKEDADNFDPPARSEWEVAGHYAARMLPNIFRPDSPVLAIQLPLETEQALEALLAKLPVTVFQADDSLGWSYQFWQAPKKEAVQRQMKQAGTKVGADELPAVTQLFTEQYMVAFLLENALGGWWQSRHPRMALPVEMPYFRKLDDGAPAAGTFPAWPDTLAQFKLLDPCAGSGHFLVSAFHYLVPMRVATEKLSVRDAIDKVLADNLHGLELDARCVEIAAFALALAAWRYPDESGNLIGYRPLPRLNIACVGVAPRSKKADWLKLAGGDERLEGGMAALYTLFQKAPELGSLIDPMAATRGDLLDAHWEELASRLDQALAGHDDEMETEARVAAQGMVQASRILTRKYHLVITNPPYLGAAQHGPLLKDFCEEHYKAAKGDLANVFLDRSLKLCTTGGVVSFVMPQNWLFLGRYQKQREHLLKYATWNLLARLGEHGFDSTDAAGAFTILLTLTHARPSGDQMLRGLDASAPKTPEEKAKFLRSHAVSEASQQGQLSNPDGRIAMGKLLTQNLPSLAGQSIDDRYLNELINPAPDETVLRWLAAPDAIQAEQGAAWDSLVASTLKRFGVDLAKGSLDVAQRILASKSGEAAYPLWEKYVAHWHSYPDAYEVFRGIAPPDLFQGAERYPRENDADEKRLSDELLKAASLEPVAAAQAVLTAEAKHAARRKTLWAQQGRAPLATALADLARIAKAFLEPLAGGNAVEAAQRYAENGWRVDAVALAAMAIAQQAELEKPIYAVLIALYRRWLEKQAEGFQDLVKKDGYPDWSLPEVADGTVVLFVDGLRLDLARELEAVLHKDNGLTVALEPGFTSIPSVTSSGKVWVSPACKLADGGNGGDFSPKLPKGAYTAEKLRKAMEPEGVAVVDTENPSLAYGKGWAEFPGDIDSDGHAKGLKLARSIPAHLDDLAKAIRRLLNAGWKQVWVVTDHGWLLLPGGLPKAELPAKLTETKWGRCAVLKDAAADNDWLVLPWSFDPAVRVALAPGISAFSSGREYDHGGLSLQESVVPFMRVQRNGPVAGQPRLLSVTWNTRKTICSMLATDAAGLTVSLERLGSAIGDADTIDADGKGRVVFEEVDDLIGEQIAVVLRRDGQKVAEERMNFGEAWNGA